MQNQTLSADQEKLKSIAVSIYHAWEKALANKDIEGLLKLYAQDAIVESPLIPHLLGAFPGICVGQVELRRFIEQIIQRQPSIRRFYMQNLFTDGKTLIFEYPRQSPEGEQMDFMEVVEIKDGLIQHHKVYWGWRGFKVMQDNLHWC